ncbi:hypothetical protein ADICEAN_03794 [Cesiribacter andamanensis AMV16]|uniref:Uncharacterized protein n=2 Tax=Cesiribacter TaxID=1133570 RepID=M7NGV7_9BACT|nr:hypothetical protein ADICEAN_03794 [Cesiribacter andamanensis AMV16]
MIPALLMLAACNVEEGGTEEHTITATINGENWYFYDATIRPSDEGGMVLRAMGYLLTEQDNAERANLEITFTGLSSPDQLREGYVAEFAATNTGNSAFAVLRLPNQQLMFDTKLDPETQGTFTVESVEDNQMSGTFSFVAKDQLGRPVTVESGDFDEVEIIR